MTRLHAGMEPSPATLIGFYSFKGGVGRSISAAHIAYHYARSGKRVLLVDADLEAPGLSFWNSDLEQAPHQRGLLQLLIDLAPRDVETEMSAALAGGETTAIRDALAHYVQREPEFFDRERKLSSQVMSRCRQPVHLLPAGVMHESLQDYVAGLHGAQRSFSTATDLLRRCLRRSGYDIVLIDSRTGLHSIGAALFSELADYFVLLFGPGRQNYQGFVTSLEMLTASQAANTVFVMSPVAWGGAKRLADVERAIEGKVPGGAKSFPRLITIAWHPDLAHEERLIAVTDPRSPTARNYQELFVEIETLRGYGIDRFTRRADSLLDIYKQAVAAGPGERSGLDHLVTVLDREAHVAFSDSPEAHRQALASYLRGLTRTQWKDWATRDGLVRLLFWEIVRCLNNLAELDEFASEALWSLIIRRNLQKSGDNRLPSFYKQVPGSREGLARAMQILRYQYKERFGREVRDIEDVPPLNESDPITTTEVSLQQFLDGRRGLT